MSGSNTHSTDADGVDWPPGGYAAVGVSLVRQSFGTQPLGIQVREMVSQVAARTLRPLRLGSGQASTSSGRTDFASSEEDFPVRAESFHKLRTGSVEARTALPDNLIDAVAARTDGVPLSVEELTKTVLESIESIGSAIPTTLQDSLMARLDRLGPAKEIAQMGATIGREFTYELLQAVSPLNEDILQRGLKQLVEAELVYQSGLPPQARYLFKHALVQGTAYQSLLKSRRQQLHQQVARVLEEQFPQTVETQPELVARHYTEAGLIAQAIPYWQRAGQGAAQRSANLEAISHFTKALELLKTLPDTPERNQQELTLQITLGTPLMATKGFAAPEVEKVYARALEMCRRMGETPQLFRMLYGLRVFYMGRAQHKTAHELAERLLNLAERIQDRGLLLQAHYALGNVLFFLGKFALALEHVEQGVALYNPRQDNPHASGAITNIGVGCQGYASWALWFLGYPDQTLKRAHEVLARTHEVSSLTLEPIRITPTL
jgi:tetratricopeptide (TPR) repeat protein